MIERIIKGSLANRWAVVLAIGALALAGVWAARTTPLDAIPDLSDVQVIVFTEYMGQEPQVVEDQVTYPITRVMLSVPHSKVVRGYSFFGASYVYILFEEGTDLYWARSRVLEYLSAIQGDLPPEAKTRLGPDATGVGWVYEYAVVDRTGRHDLAQLRSLQDWYLRYGLQTVAGVAEVASIGGYVKEYQVEVNPNSLQAYNIPLDKVRKAIMDSNSATGGGMVEMGETEFMVRSQGYIKSLEDLAAIPVGVNNRGTPIRLADVANIQLGPEMRRGLAELDGQGEVAGGVVVMRFGENALNTVRAVEAKLEELKAGLPEGVEIVPTYNRGHLIERAVKNLLGTLVEESLLVALICALFLYHVRSALVAAIALPVGVLLAFLAMRWQGINANIMSMGGIAIAIGVMVDGAVVMIENCHKHLEKARLAGEENPPLARRLQIVGQAATEVGPPLFFSLLIITVSFLPVFSLQAQEGRLFSPLAFTKTYSMAAASVLSITLVPVLMAFFIKGRIRPEMENPINRVLTGWHTPLLREALKRPRATLLAALALLLLTLWPMSRLGSEFMPPLDEGDLLYMPSAFMGLSIAKAREVVQQTDKILVQFPEVERVFGKAGRARTATDPAPLSMIETVIKLKPREQWPDPGKPTRQLMQEMDQAIRFPGIANAWTMPIKTRIDMLSTGIKTPVGIKISGPDLAVLQALSLQVEAAMVSMEETTSAYGDRSLGGYFLDFDIDRAAAARYGLTVGAVQRVIAGAVGGMAITETVEGLERYPVSLRYPRELRDNPEALRRVRISTPTGAQIPLEQLATIRISQGAPDIKSEGGRPNAWVYVDTQSSDIGGFVEKARQVVAGQVQLPPGYTLSWSGQFEYMERAAKRLQVVVPVTLLIILLLLYLHFRTLSGPLLVMASIPMALIGGYWWLYLAGYNMSVAVGVGFIALAGLSVEIGVLVITFIDQKLAEKRAARPKKGPLSAGEIMAVVEEAAKSRLRPISMTTGSTVMGLLPILWSHGAGSDVMARIAAPMLGGLFSATLLGLVVLPVLYGQWLLFKERPPAWAKNHRWLLGLTKTEE